MTPAALPIFPALACFFWVVVHLLMASRVSTFRVYATLLLTLGVANVLFWMGGTWGHVFLQLLAPSAIPLLVMYLEHLGKDSRNAPLQLLWVLIPAILFSVTVVLAILLGKDATPAPLPEGQIWKSFPALQVFSGTPLHMYYVWTEWVLRGVMYLEAVLFGVYVVRVSRREHLRYSSLGAFLRQGGEMGTKELQIVCTSLAMLLIVAWHLLTDNLVFTQTWPAIVYTVLYVAFIFLVSFIALLSAKKTVTLRQMATLLRFNYRKQNQAPLLREMVGDMVEGADTDTMQQLLEIIGTYSNPESLQGAQDNPGSQGLAAAIFSAVSKSWDEESLVSRFQHLMIDEQVFLRPGLTITDVAQRLHSNKTYVSRMVNQTYNLGFPELINILRIDYAEQYITSHRDANQEEIAKSCGFPSASSFNSTFKRITGYTPRVWAARKNMETSL